MILRPYQSAALAAVTAALGKRPVLVAPTGSGKTVMGCSLASDFEGRVLWIAHRRELVFQARDQLRLMGLHPGVMMAADSFDSISPLTVASVQTMNARINRPHADLIVIDEAHHACAGSYGFLFEHYSRAKFVGLTATPFRLDGRGLGDLFGELVVAATTRQLVDAGTLHAPVVYSSSSPDMTGVKLTAGDFNLRAASTAVNRPDLVGDIVDEWQRRAWGKRTVVFATSIEHSQAITAQFNAGGILAEHIDGGTPKDQRDATLARLRSGETMVVSNCQVLTEGWDLPALECAVIARPTASLCLHLQMIGRIMRSCDGKAGAIVLDHAGNHHRHGAVTRSIGYDLNGVTRKGTEPLGLKTCPACFLMVETELSECPECGYEFTADSREPVQVAVGTLTEFADDTFEYRAEYWLMIESERELAGYAAGWSKYRYHDRFGVWPLVVNGELIDATNATKEQKAAVWMEIETRRNAAGYAQGWTAHKYREIFGVWPRGVMDTISKLNRKWESERV